MNLTVPKKELLRIATRMAGVAERKSTMPVLANVLFQTNGQAIKLAATDLYLSLTGGATASIDKPGTVAVSAKDLVDRVKAMPEGDIAMTERDGSLLLKSGTRKFTLRGMRGDDYPPIPEPQPDAAKLSIDVGVLSGLIAQTIFSASVDETRPHMNCVYFEWTGNTVRMVSTDGHRLSKAERQIDGSASTQLLIPLKALREVQRISDEMYSAQGETRAQLEILSAGAYAFFVGGGMTFGVKLTDAQFPPYQQVIPKEWSRKAIAPRIQLLDAVKSISLAAHEKTSAIKFSLSKNKLLISSESPDGGDGSDELTITYDGPNMAIGFNSRYVIDILGAINSQEVMLGLNGELDPLVVKPESDAKDTDSLFVVMPMRI